jgi:hypothetical protein
MTAWAKPDQKSASYADIARDIVEVSGEPKMAITMASLAFWESRFWKHVDDGGCNTRRKEIRALMSVTGDCDGGIAWSLWQIHAFGVVLTPDGEWKYAWDDHANPGQKSLTGADLIADRKLAARVAMAMVRKSLRLSGGTLCGYSGEPGPCPKAAQRQQFAESWLRKHPFAAP